MRAAAAAERPGSEGLVRGGVRKTIVTDYQFFKQYARLGELDVHVPHDDEQLVDCTWYPEGQDRPQA
jgi:hypothetical protein